MLQSLSDAEYNDVVFVLQSMPKLNIEPRFEGMQIHFHPVLLFIILMHAFILIFPVQGEDDAQKVTVGSVVTLKIVLTRSPLLDSNKREEQMRESSEKVLLTHLIWSFLG